MAFARYFYLAGLVLILLIQLLAGNAMGVSLHKRSEGEFSNLHKELDQPAFWQKPLIWQQIKTDRKIPVSVTRKENRWSFKGAGLADAPRSFCFEQAKDFGRLRTIPAHFKEVVFDPKTSILSLRIHFLGRERKMHLLMFEENLKNESRIYFRSVRGWLMGLEGVLLLKDQAQQSTEIGLIALYPGKMSWVPDWLFSVAAEGVMHHVAETLRKSLETDYKTVRGEIIGVQRN